MYISRLLPKFIGNKQLTQCLLITVRLLLDFSIQCSDTVGWASGLQKRLGVDMLVVTDCNFVCLIAPVVTTTSITLSPVKSRMETFWYRLTQVHLESGH